MPSSQLSYADASRVLHAALEKAEELECAQRVTIAVTDAAGHLVTMLRMDDRWFQGEIAMARAYCAAALRRDGKLTGSLLDSRAFWRTVPEVMAGRVALGPGGVLLREDENTEYHHGLGEKILGAIGVSGVSEDVDEAVARAGAAATVKR